MKDSTLQPLHSRLYSKDIVLYCTVLYSLDFVHQNVPYNPYMEVFTIQALHNRPYSEDNVMYCIVLSIIWNL